MNTEQNALGARIVELEMKVTYQDKTIEDLNETVTSLQRDVQLLERLISQVKQKLSPSSMTEADINVANEKPPHY